MQWLVIGLVDELRLLLLTSDVSNNVILPSLAQADANEKISPAWWPRVSYR